MQKRKARKSQSRIAWNEKATGGKAEKPQDATRVTLAKKPRTSRVPALQADDIAQTPKHAKVRVVRRSQSQVRADMSEWQSVPDIDAIMRLFERNP